MVIHTGVSISGPAMRDTLEECLAAAHAVIMKHGDVYMFPDPYMFKLPPKQFNGLVIEAQSLMVPGLLWTDLGNMLDGIHHVMLGREIYKEAHVKMYDVPSGEFMGILELYKTSQRSTSRSLMV